MFCVGVDVCTFEILFRYKIQCVCPHSQLERRHFVSAVVNNKGVGTQEQYCS